MLVSWGLSERVFLPELSDTRSFAAVSHNALIRVYDDAEVHAVVQFLAVTLLMFDQFVIARRCLQRQPDIIVCRWIRDLRLNLAGWPHPFIWFVHCGISPNECQCRAG